MDSRIFTGLDFFPEADDTPADRLAAKLAEEMAEHWARGQYCRADEALARHPELQRQPRAVLRLVYEELCLRQSAGEDVAEDDLRCRFPWLRKELDALFDCHRILELAPQSPVFPKAGEELGEFRVVAELGRGAMARVFLAEHSFLADRLVVLKTMQRTGREHLTLARLQHTHVVPLYAVADFPERNLRALCMPCLGGTTLDRILGRLAGVAPGRRSGADLLRALAEGVAHPRMFWPGRGSSWSFLQRASYSEAICWIGLCAAEALHHAAERDLVHLDLKPSNLLLTADGQPMLLDFHLARAPVAAGQEAPAWLGGTPAYMSPEQHMALDALHRGEPVAVAVDGRSDVYSLGLLLAEALGGQRGVGANAVALAGRELRHLPRGLRDILARAVREEPAKRYADPAELAEDLRCHLTNRPLAGVRNRSLLERWRKWRHRQPHALLISGLVSAFLATAAALAGFALVATRHHSAAKAAALATAKDQLDRRKYSEAVATLDRALTLAGESDSTLATELRRLQRLAARGRAAVELHAQAERLRFAYGDDSLTPETLRRLESFCREAWSARELLLDTTETKLDAELEEQLRTDLFDVAVLWADFHQRSVRSGDAKAARQEALAILTEAEALFGPGAVLAQEQRAMGGHVEGVAPRPRTAWEHYAVGRWLVRTGELDRGAAELDKALAQRPHDFWAWFWRGLCAFRLHRYDDAATAFTVCIALTPDSATCYYNRGLAHAARRMTEPAREDYNRALELDPGLAAAALNRGVLSLRENRNDEAVADFERALADGAEPASVHFNLALAHQANHDRAAALTSVWEALRHRPDHREARELRDRLLSAR